MSKEQVPIITIDGPSGTGKGTISKRVVEHLQWHFLDSGAIYRVLALAARKHDMDFENKQALICLAESLELRFDLDENKQMHVFLEEEDVSQMIREESCGMAAAKIACIPEIRAALLQRQRAFAKPPGLVADGRDMGTVVFPDADLKIYLDATVEERAQRRYLQLKETQNDVSLAQVVEDLAKRDERDKSRKHSPLKPAADAEVIDTTSMSIVQVFNHVLKLVNQRILSR